MQQPTQPLPSRQSRRGFSHAVLLFACSALLSPGAPAEAPVPDKAPPAPPAMVPLVPDKAPPLPPAAPGEPPAPGQITAISETSYRLGKVEFDQVKRTITFGAALNMNQGIVEYALVTETGKVHEALLSTDISPFNLNLTLLLLHYKPAENFFRAQLPPPGKQPAPGAKPAPIDKSSGLDVEVTWKDKDGKDRTIFLEEWIHNQSTKKKAKRGPFIYTGSKMDGGGLYGAEMTGSIIGLFSDPMCMFNNPRNGSDSDEIWSVGPNVPPLQTQVRVTLRPHQGTPAKTAGK